MSTGTVVHQLPFGHRLGVFILAEISAVSASSVIILLGYIAYCTLTVRQGASCRWRLSSPVHLFLLNQLVCDLIQALGGLMNLKWMIDGNIHPGGFCTTQGIIKQLADVGTALSAGNVAIYTFGTLIFRLRPDTNLCRAVFIVAGIWIAIILNVGINIGINGASHFYGPTGAWCWIAKEFPVQRTAGDFLWMWISAFSSVLAYVAVFLVLSGFIQVEGWRVRWARRQGSPSILPSQTLAYKMLAYPIIYIITVLPLAAARYNDFANGNTPFSVVILADGFYLSSGFLNVILYRYTRPYLLPHHIYSSDDQSIVLDANSQNHLTGTGFVGSVMDIKPENKAADSVYEASQISSHNQNASGTYRTYAYAFTTSSVHDEMHIKDEPTGAGA